MTTTGGFLDALRSKFSVPSDYALEARTGWVRQQISRYRTGRSTFDDETCIKVAGWLECDPGYVMACMAAQRTRSLESRAVWERVAKKVAACIMLWIGASMGGMPMQAEANGALHNKSIPHHAVQITHYAKLRRWLSRLWRFPSGALNAA